MNKNKFESTLTKYICQSIPFIFVVDFESQMPFICKLEDAKKEGIFYDIKGNTNFNYNMKLSFTPQFESIVIDEHIYNEKIRETIKHINKGDSYLLNLSFPSELKINISLNEIFNISEAPYKLLFKDKFTLFSPECFIKIIKNQIFTYPMKGTIDASKTNAEQILLYNRKEQAEHNTIVDLMRNDMAMIAKDIELTRYRYVEKIKTNKNEILQTSSEIKGLLPTNWKKEFGKNLMKLLPAGSISGAPKKKTVEIIQKIEIDKRGYYSGIFGIYDGAKLDSAVSIRYIEQKDGKMFFRSGGGITSQSQEKEEYMELKEKIYIPIS